VDQIDRPEDEGVEGEGIHSQQLEINMRFCSVQGILLSIEPLDSSFNGILPNKYLSRLLRQ
jgi:hypothetical protein